MAATVAELTARLVADTRQFNAAMAASTGQVAKLQSTAATSGAGTARSLGLIAIAVGLVGAKAVDMYLDFNAALTRVQALVGDSAAQVDAWGGQILDLAGEVGRPPQELAEALYFVRSSGIAAGKSMEVVRAAAQAAAAGLGDTAVVADAATSAMNAYGAENLSAAQATSILVATVREGKAEADAVAGAIGRVIPIAAQMGVEFHEVGGAIAAMTTVGLDANEAVTALRGIFVALLRPQEQAREQLAQYGLSAEALRSQLGEEGLFSVLQTLAGAFGQNEEAVARVFPEVRGLIGVLNLVGSNAENAERIFSSLAGTTERDLAEAFRKTAESDAFKVQQAFAEIQAAMIRLGGAIAPLVVSFAQLAGAMAPLLRFAPELLAVFLTYKALAFLPALMRSTSTSVFMVGAAGAATTTKVSALRVSLMGLVSASRLLRATLIVVAFEVLTRAMESANTSAKDLSTELGVAESTIDAFTREVEETSLANFVHNLADVTALGNTVVREMSDAWVEFRNEALAAGFSMEDLQDAFQATSGSLNANRASIEGWIEQMRVALGFTPEWQRQGEAYAGMAVAFAAANPELAKAAQATAKVRDEHQALGSEMQNVASIMGMTWSDFSSQLDAAQLEGGKALDQFTGNVEKAVQDWQNSLREGFDVVGPVLEQFAGKANVDLGKVNAALQKQTRSLVDYSRDWKVVSERAGGKADDLRMALANMGLEGAGILRALATASRKEFNTFVGNVARGQRQSESLVDVISQDLVGSIDRLTAAIKGLPGFKEIKIKADTSQAQSSIQGFYNTWQGRTILMQAKIAHNVHEGGLIGHAGGLVRFHRGNLATDEVAAVLQRGEFIVRNSAVRRVGTDVLEAINSGRVSAVQGPVGVRGGDGVTINFNVYGVRDPDDGRWPGVSRRLAEEVMAITRSR